MSANRNTSSLNISCRCQINDDAAIDERRHYSPDESNLRYTNNFSDDCPGCQNPLMNQGQGCPLTQERPITQGYPMAQTCPMPQMCPMNQNQACPLGPNCPTLQDQNQSRSMSCPLGSACPVNNPALSVHETNRTSATQQKLEDYFPVTVIVCDGTKSEEPKGPGEKKAAEAPEPTKAKMDENKLVEKKPENGKPATETKPEDNKPASETKTEDKKAADIKLEDNKPPPEDKKPEEDKQHVKIDETKNTEKLDLTPIKESKAPLVWLLGRPGTGKNTQAQKIVDKFPGYTHVSVGDLLREEVKAGTPRSPEIEKVMKEGGLVPTNIVTELVYKKMLTDLPNTKAFLVDGFPRNKEQAAQFSNDAKPPASVLYLDAPDEDIQARLLERGKTSGRPDDTEEVIKKRMETTKENDNPILEEYEPKVVKVDASKPPDDVFKDIEVALNNVKLE